jgi:hypothetical protein
MAASETRIPVSTDTRRELRHVKAEEERHTYDDAIGVLLDAYGSDGSTKGDS